MVRGISIVFSYLGGKRCFIPIYDTFYCTLRYLETF